MDDGDGARRTFHNPAAAAYAIEVESRFMPAFRDHGIARNVPYGREPHQLLDIYGPRDHMGSALPVLVFIHGGGWTAGCKEWMGFMAPAISKLPALLVTPSYSLAPRDRWPIPFEDCAAAVAWVHRNIHIYGGDGNHMLVGGHSAGAHLAACVATRSAAETDIAGCCVVSGTFDMRFDSVVSGSMEERIVRDLLRDEADMPDASPLLFVSRHTPPFLLAMGEHDYPRIHKQAASMAAALRDQGKLRDVISIPGSDHFGASTALVDESCGWLAGVQSMFQSINQEEGRLS
jgi:acetyl esterase/lipase